MLKILFFFTFIIISLSSCFRYDYSKYTLYFKPNGIIYQGEKEGLQIVLKDIQHINKYKPEGTATLIVTCQSKPKTDTFQVNINTQHLDNRYQMSFDSISTDVLFRERNLDMHVNFSMRETYFRNINFATFYCTDSVVIDKDWDILLKHIPTSVQK